MSASPPSLSVWVDDNLACVKITGRAACPGSVDFRRLMLGLRDKGLTRFVLDLTDCQLMDSTFLGVMAWLVLHFGESHPGQPPAHIELLNPTPRITDLLDNLGVAQLFQVHTGVANICGALTVPEACNPDRAEVSRTSLEAHQLLCRLDPKNTPRFKDVCQFLKDDLAKLAVKHAPVASEEVIKPG